MKTLIQKNSIAIIIILIGVIAAGGIFYFNKPQIKNLTAEEAGQKAIEFINQSIEESVSASLLEVIENDSIYKIRLDIQGTEYESFITKDGKFLFPTGFELESEALSESQQEETVVEPADLASFTQCLAGQGKFYGAFWCTWCNSQKELFAESAAQLPYVECSDAETREMLSACSDVGVTSYPTWEFNGELTSGFKTFEELSQLSGCSLQ
ncbi:MAG: hypothetical protein ABH805_02300 [Candidatus Nealsonbacteria bacterium]